MTDLRRLGVSLWQPIHLEEVELIVREVVGDPASRLHESIRSMPDPVDDEVQSAVDETLADYRRKYNLQGGER